MLKPRLSSGARPLFGLFLAATLVIAGGTVDSDRHTNAEAIAPDLYRLSSTISVLTRGCVAEGGDVRVDRRNQKLIFLTEGNVEECNIETWVAPTAI